MNGAVAAGSQATVDAGLFALEKGGNAIDAAIASTLMAGVAEPLLSGLGGSGLATVRFNGEVFTVDFFANMPGSLSSRTTPAEMDEVSIDFGPTTQRFLVGEGSAAVPGLPAGMWALAERFGVLPMDILAQPAIEAAIGGVPVTPGFERVLELLWPILRRSEDIVDLFSTAGQRLRAGDTFRCPDLARTLSLFASDPDFFRTGAGAQAFLSEIGHKSSMSNQDFLDQATIIKKALSVDYGDSTVWVPGAPSMASFTIAHALNDLSGRAIPDDPRGFSALNRMAHALQSAAGIKSKAFLMDLFTPDFDERFLARLRARQASHEAIKPGYTTHISTVDAAGNAVAITHSLGETAGVMAGSTGVLINNFLGEEDVNPPGFPRPPGERLLTMCCPTIIEHSDGRIIVMGSGGSSRIPTAVVHGTSYLLDYGWTIAQAVEGPRTHIDESGVNVESSGRTEKTMDLARTQWPSFIRFDGPNMFFGGLHTVSGGPDGFVGAGDPRRSGASGKFEP